MDTMIDRKSERYKVARELLRAERSPLEKAKALKILKDIQDSQMLLIAIDTGVTTGTPQVIYRHSLTVTTQS